MSRVVWTPFQGVTQPGRAALGWSDAPCGDRVNDRLAPSISVVRFMEAQDMR